MLITLHNPCVIINDALFGLFYTSIILFCFGAYKREYNFILTWFLYTGAMYCLITVQSWIWFVFFWECVSFFSFILIGLPIASNALIINIFGGMCLLLTQIAPDIYAPYLIAIGILTKSAQWPFNAWIYQVAKAPDYLSAFLHAATLVQCGLILLARIAFFDERLNTMLYISSFITALSCLLENKDKSLIVCATQVFIASSLLEYSAISHIDHLDHSLWLEIICHMHYKSALFLLIDRQENRYWWGVGMLHSVLMIYWYAAPWTFPSAIMGWKLFKYLYNTRPTQSSIYDGIPTLFVSYFAPASMIISVCADYNNVLIYSIILGLGWLSSMNTLIWITLSLLLSMINIRVPFYSIPSFPSPPYITLGMRFCVISSIICLGIYTNFTCNSLLLLCPIIMLIYGLEKISVPIILLLGWISTTYIGLYCAPDVMITQCAVDCILLLYLLGNRLKIPDYNNDEKNIRYTDLFLSILFGITLYCIMLMHEPQQCPLLSFDTHPVNTVVSDKRALDTWAEMCVLSIAGLLGLKNQRSIKDFTANQIEHKFWALQLFYNILVSFAVIFLLRSESYGALYGLILILVYQYQYFNLFGSVFSIILALWMLNNTHGHSGGFATGVVLGVVNAATNRVSTKIPYPLIAAGMTGYITQWSLYGYHGFWSSAWLFEVYIAGIVMWSIHNLIHNSQDINLNQQN